MAIYSKTFECGLSPEEAFDYLADFTSCAEWDKGVVEAKRLGTGDIGNGSQFSVVVEVPGPNLTLEYVMSDYDRPNSFTLDAKHPLLTSHDVVIVEPTDDGCRVTYEAKVELPGPFRLLDGIFGVGFEKTAGRAGRGLEKTLQAMAS